MVLRRQSEVRWYGEEVKATIRAAAVTGLHLATEHWLGASRQEVPLEEATLERSGTPSVDEANLTGAVSFDTPYAVIQHENPDYHHDDGRKWKYLEDPGNREAPVMGALLATAIKAAIGPDGVPKPGGGPS